MKVRVSISIDEELAKEIKQYRRKIIKSLPDDADEPNLSNVYEDVLKRGWRTTKK